MNKTFMFLMALLLCCSLASASSFNISERTEYGISENVVYLRVCDNLGKDQYVDVSSVFSDDILTRNISFNDDLNIKLPFNNVVYEDKLVSIGKYASSNLSSVDSKGNSSGNITKYYDSKGVELVCESVLADKSCMQTKNINTKNFTSMEYQSLPVLNQKIAVDGLKIEQKSSGIPLAKGSCVDLKYSYKHPLAYKLEVPDKINKYDIWIDNGIEQTILDPIWFNASWNNSKEINLSGVSANTSDYQLRLVISKAGNMNANFSDLRFLVPDNSTERPYWIQEYNSTQAIVWLNVSIFNGTVAYMYYGNPSAISESNGTNTFIFFDDFLTLDTNVWNSYGPTAMTSNGTHATCGGSSWCQMSSKINNSAPITIGYKYEKVMAAYGNPLCISSVNNGWGNAYDLSPYGTSIYYMIRNTPSNTLNSSSAGFWAGGIGELKVKGGALYSTWYVNGTIYNGFTNNNDFGNNLYYLMLDPSTGDATDWVYERKYLAVEPSYSFGGENVKCAENLTNLTPVFVQNLSCLSSDLLNQSWNFTTYDANACGFTANSTTTFYSQNVSCNYCSYSVVNSSGSWSNISCVLGDLMNQTRNVTEYDENYVSCYAVTNLSSDLWNGGNNNTYVQYRLNGSCDFCVSDLQNTSWSNWSNQVCLNTGYWQQMRTLIQYDLNNCSDYANFTFSDYTSNTTNCTSGGVVVGGEINFAPMLIIFILALFSFVMGLVFKQPIILFVAGVLFVVLSAMGFSSYGVLLGSVFLVFTLMSVVFGLMLAWS